MIHILNNIHGYNAGSVGRIRFGGGHSRALIVDGTGVKNVGDVTVFEVDKI